MSVFLNRARPKGLEFAACRECHDGTRGMDAVAGMVSRLFPTPDTDEGRAEVRKHIKGVINNHRELAMLFHDQQRRGAEVLYGGKRAIAVRVQDNEKLNRCMNGFAARIGFALHRETVGRRVDDGATLIARWMANVELDRNADLDAFLRSIGAPNSLEAGEWQVADQFRYWAAVAEDNPSTFTCFAAFRKSFGIFAAVLRDPLDVPLESIQFRPGFLKSFTF